MPIVEFLGACPGLAGEGMFAHSTVRSRRLRRWLVFATLLQVGVSVYVLVYTRLERA